MKSNTPQIRPHLQLTKSLDNILCKAMGFLEEHRSIVSSANKEIDGLFQKAVAMEPPLDL